MRRIAFLLAALLIAAPALAQTAAETEFAHKAEAAISHYIDEARAKNAPGAPRLKPDAELLKIARARSADLAHGAPFSHQDHLGNYPAIDMVKARFGPYGFIGENIAAEWGYFGDGDIDAFARRTVDGWMGSEEHRANILLPDFDASGIGVVVLGDHAYITQVFRGDPPPPKRHTQPLRPKGAAGEWSPNGGF
jgi:uncharacterized protein YkwD